jgi:hypothetical protein
MRLAKPRLGAASVIALTLALAGCGGNTVTVQEVPGGPVDLTVPGSAEALAPQPTATPSATPTDTPEADASQATPTPDAGTGTADESQSQTTPQTDTGADGAAEAPSTDDSATNDQPPPAGSDAQKFEDFCAQNPGAC